MSNQVNKESLDREQHLLQVVLIYWWLYRNEKGFSANRPQFQKDAISYYEKNIKIGKAYDFRYWGNKLADIKKRNGLIIAFQNILKNFQNHIISNVIPEMPHHDSPPALVKTLSKTLRFDQIQFILEILSFDPNEEFVLLENYVSEVDFPHEKFVETDIPSPSKNGLQENLHNFALDNNHSEQLANSDATINNEVDESVLNESRNDPSNATFFNQPKNENDTGPDLTNGKVAKVVKLKLSTFISLSTAFALIALSLMLFIYFEIKQTNNNNFNKISSIEQYYSEFPDSFQKLKYSQKFVNSFNNSTFNLSQGPDGYECPTFAIGNYTTGEGIKNGEYGCWTLKSVRAKKGQGVNVSLFFENSTNSIAFNVHLKLWMNPSSGMSDHFTFQAEILSDQAILLTDTVTVHLDTPGSLIYINSKLSSGYGRDTTFENKKVEDLFYNKEGLNLGTVRPGPPASGYIVSGFAVVGN